MRYFLELAYNGATYHGWQSQPNALGVQSVIESALTTVLRVPTPIVGAGRTDTGVNARVMYAHFDAEKPIADAERFLLSLNRICGPSIALRRLIPVHDTAHARFDATERTYKYFVIYQKSPFLGNHAWFCHHPLDVEAMNSAASLLLKTEDFTSFAKLHSDAKTNICDVGYARWEEYENPYNIPGLVFTISADRFLRNMVRAIVGTLVDVGRGKTSIADLENIIARRDRCAAGTSMPAEPLFLWDIKYPFITQKK